MVHLITTVLINSYKSFLLYIIIPQRGIDIDFKSMELIHLVQSSGKLCGNINYITGGLKSCDCTSYVVFMKFLI